VHLYKSDDREEEIEKKKLLEELKIYFAQKGSNESNSSITRMAVKELHTLKLGNGDIEFNILVECNKCGMISAIPEFELVDWNYCTQKDCDSTSFTYYRKIKEMNK